MTEAERLLSSTNNHAVINADKTITLPYGFAESVIQGDHNVDKLTFDCPRYWDGLDLTTLNLYVNYLSSDGKGNHSFVNNTSVDSDDSNTIHFTWILDNNATVESGTLAFMVCGQKYYDGSNKEYDWNTRINDEIAIQKGIHLTEETLRNIDPTEMEQLIQIANAAGGILNTSISNATSVKTGLDNSIYSSNTVKANLESSINYAVGIKQDLDDVIQAQQFSFGIHDGLAYIEEND